MKYKPKNFSKHKVNSHEQLSCDKPRVTYREKRERRNADLSINMIGMPVRPTLGIIPSGHNTSGAGLLTPLGVGTIEESHIHILQVESHKLHKQELQPPRTSRWWTKKEDNESIMKASYEVHCVGGWD